MPTNSVFNWRWDQGRIDYFRFDNIKSIAKVLAGLDGVSLGAGQQDNLREPLRTQTGLPFAVPATHKIWRNYGRVLECCFLASDPNRVLTITDVCRRLAGETNPPVNVDEYLSFLAPRFYYPFPAFDNYEANVPRCFPFCATLKYLLAKSSTSEEESISLDDIFSYIIGNGCLGTEPLGYFLELQPTSHTSRGAQKRQVRELLIFFSQFSFLKWHRNRLFLDIRSGDSESIAAARQMAEPIASTRAEVGADEILALGSGFTQPMTATVDTTRREPADVLFTEGHRVRVTHLRTERSPYLRRLLFANSRQAYTCNMCGRNMRRMYPWTDNILEVHHLLPLSSALTITSTGTSLQDVVPLCPNCHRSVHVYYKQWLNNHSLEDFRSHAEAGQVYAESKRLIVQ